MNVPSNYGFDPGNPAPETVVAWLDDGHPRAGSDSYRTVVMGNQREIVEFLQPPPFRRGTPMHATLDRSGPGSATVLEWQEVHHHDIGLGDIPAHWVSRQGRPATVQIERLVAGIEDLAIADLARAVLPYPTVAMRFFRAPASRTHHHAFPGGLAVHSEEVARFGAKMLIPDNPAHGYEADLVTAAALLHDLGKCLPGVGFEAHEAAGQKLVTLVSQRLPDTGCQQHKDVLSILAPKLSREASESAVRRAVRHADQSSAGRAASAIAFKGAKSDRRSSFRTWSGAVSYERFPTPPNGVA